MEIMANANDTAWSQLLQEHPHIITSVNATGFCDIEAELIKQYREPRLMCKIDFRSNIPKPFDDNNLSILAIVNSKYRIAKTDPFISIDSSVFKSKGVDKTFSIPEHLESLDWQNISSESKALDAAKASGMIDYLVNEQNTYLTIRGRVFSRDFSFSLTDSENRRINYPVNGVQIEVDGGYEGLSNLLLIEAKMGLSSDMNIRQLLYPQINFSTIVKKPVKTYTLFYQSHPNGGLFHFLPFIYHSGETYFDTANYRLFKLEQPENILDIDTLLLTKIDNSQTGFGKPFPQADRLDKVIQVLLIIGRLECATKEEIFLGFDLVTRQWDYYLNALIWLGLAEEDPIKSCYVLTDKGISLLSVNESMRLLKIAQIFFSNDIFNAFLNNDKPHISESIKKRNGFSSDSTTFGRRMSTVRSWKKFVLG